MGSLNGIVDKYARAQVAALATGGVFTPLIRGSVVAGVAVGVAAGWYKKIDDLILFNLNASWSSHSGSGNIFIDLNDMPYSSAVLGGSYAFQVLSYNLTFSGQLTGYLQAGSKVIQLVTQSSGGSYAGVPVDDSVADLIVTGMFRAS